jgi:hypothetical protein
MKRSFAVLTFALSLLPVPLAAQAPADPEFTLGQYQALTIEQRTLYIAGLADMLDAAAAMAPSNNRLPIIAACTHGFGRDDLMSAVEAGAGHIQMKWAETAPAAEWFITTMIYVCQLQLPPPEQ